jgi:lysozyme
MNLCTGIIDIHHGEPHDFLKARAGGVVAVILKATQGKDWHDPEFQRSLIDAQAADLLAGAYHFGSGSSPGAQQADLCLAAVHPDVHPDVRIALDLEHNPDLASGDMTTEQAAAFCQRVHDVTGRWPILYAGLDNLRNRMAVASLPVRAIFACCALWLAAYGPDPMTVKVPAPWHEWSLFQYSDWGAGPSNRTLYPRDTPGFGRVDRSCFRGTADELRAWWATVGT